MNDANIKKLAVALEGVTFTYERIHWIRAFEKKLKAFLAKDREERDDPLAMLVELRSLKMKEAVAKEMHSHHCRLTSIYHQDDRVIETAWAADSKNRKGWFEQAAAILAAVERALMNKELCKPKPKGDSNGNS